MELDVVAIMITWCRRTPAAALSYTKRHGQISQIPGNKNFLLWGRLRKRIAKYVKAARKPESNGKALEWILQGS